MRLELESIEINDIQEGSKTFAEDCVLYVNLKELEELILGDSRIASVDINLVYPGDKTRILNVQDVVQPRCKVDKENADFPGFINKMQIAGDGKTRSLKGVAVIVSNPSTNRRESGLLDMSGPAAELSPYGKMKNVSIALYAADGVEERDFEDAVKNAGLLTAVYLAKGAEGHPVSQVEVYDLDIPNLDNNLPRVACYYQAYSPQFDYLAVSDRIVYGTALTNMVPTVYHPNEILDGGFVGWNALKAIDTYSIQNHGVIKELLKNHGKTLNFVGVVAVSANMNAESRERCACMSANLIKNVLGADGAILVKILGGMPHIDISATGEECEKLGVKTAVFTTPLTAVGTLSDTILFNSESLDLIITSCAPFERTKVPFKAEKFLGGTAETRIYHPEPVVQYAGDPEIDVEQYLLAGVHDHTGSAKVVVKEY
ncbi:glycine/sarcosine/betaine reductase component B subunit [Candidatus Contubernalis alkaliaceticus]|uniref:glycine/sarcosine/betaine reductase component B subunit n=1 Tax=Candidatus Contubernalis alkaliaceticus TaxID=338645 RepID=UPI001F4C51B1|nr:glycine/sarcosine/betaine reductase component B subunit [Candidatus Contubernalis alkalaceticus]UNC92928.1 hypothetical protein HUE98_12965 [Candidatus Contubernalis alkalaceticus]